MQSTVVIGDCTYPEIRFATSHHSRSPFAVSRLISLRYRMYTFVAEPEFFQPGDGTRGMRPRLGGCAIAFTHYPTHPRALRKTIGKS